MNERMTDERLRMSFLGFSIIASRVDQGHALLPFEAKELVDEITASWAEIDRLRAENERLVSRIVEMEPPGSCDWGDCDEPAAHWRLSDRLGPAGYLPVCSNHRSDAPPTPELSKHDAFNKILDQSYRNTRGAFA